MLVVGLVTGHLTAGLRFQVRVAQHRESRARRLYEMARELSSAVRRDQLIEISVRHVSQAFEAPAAVADARRRRARRSCPSRCRRGPMPLDASIAQWVFDHQEPAGMGADTLPGSPLLYWPLATPVRCFGVLALELPSAWRTPEQKRWLDALAALIALALERLFFVEVAREATVHMESERLRNSLLGALSHDLRTPLTVLVGLAESLLLPPGLEGERREVAEALRDEALRTSILVDNLLDMVRLDSGKVELAKDWHPLEGGGRLGAAGARAAAGPPPGPDRAAAGFAAGRDRRPPDRAGAVQPDRKCGQIFAAGQPDPDRRAREGETIEVSVEDDGPGLPPGSEERLFEKFVRGRSEDAVTGVGLGLAICRAIVAAHGGSIRAENVVADAKDAQRILGSRFVFSLPLGNPPPVDEGFEAPAP